MELIDSGKVISSIKLKKLEQLIGYVIPNEFSKFILTSNGGVPREQVFFSVNEIGDNKDSEPFETDVQFFLNYDEIIEVYDNLVSEKLIKKDFLPIAFDSCGNVILLCLRNDEKHGSVFYAFHDLLPIEEDYWQMVYVSNSFDSFLSMLHSL